jgi:hypothetical protein
MNKTICIIDADYILYMWSWLEKQTSDFNTYKRKIDKTIETIISSTQADEYIGIFSDRSYRHYLYPFYKVKRTSNKPLFFNDMKQYIIDKYGFKTYKLLEADDAVIIAKRHYASLKYKVIICSPDKDLKQEEGYFYNYSDSKSEVFYNSQLDATHSLYTQLLKGDSTDNIPGLKGCGNTAADSNVNVLTNVENLIVAYISGFEYKSSDDKTKTVKGLGLCEGLNKFIETFNLIYLLRNNKDIDVINGLLSIHKLDLIPYPEFTSLTLNTTTI